MWYEFQATDKFDNKVSFDVEGEDFDDALLEANVQYPPEHFMVEGNDKPSDPTNAMRFYKDGTIEVSPGRKLTVTLAVIMSWAKEYNRDKPIVSHVDGKDFFMVGHNASHQFSLAVDAKGNIWKKASDVGGDAVFNMGQNLTDVGYIGHF
jgi:hypothetical protein